MVYIVSYDLTEPDQRSEDLKRMIKRDGRWARLGDHAYLIESDATAVELRNRFKQVLVGTDKLYVGQVVAPAAWTGLSERVSNWIKNKLTD